jgi:hypothetical protein
MTGRTAEIETLKYAWQMYFPSDVPVPPDSYLGIWAHHDNNNGLALTAIEKTAIRHGRTPLVNPAGFCWMVLKNLIAARITQQAAQ